ncbi:hypothetical protein [Henriciella sp.]|nr:hypothetical protein [Henriciella sp.]
MKPWLVRAVSVKNGFSHLACAGGGEADEAGKWCEDQYADGERKNDQVER